jgi:Hint domain
MCASFCAGTRISTTRGRVRVEKLRLGDEALTVSAGPLPIRWIGQRIYARPFAHTNPNSVPVMIRAGAVDDGVPLRDLCISPLHNVYIDGALIPVSQLVNGTSIVTCEDMDPIAYYHIELPGHAVVLAEDMPAESYVDRGDRAMFLSGTSREPGDFGPPSPLMSCARIVHSGPLVDRVRARIAWRTGITPPGIMDRPQSGPLLGKLEWIDHAVVSGWAWLTDHPTVPVVLEVVDEGEVVAVAIADRFRTDLRRAGIGDGHHGFHVDLPRPLDPQRVHRLVIRRAADGLPLSGCPLDLPADRPSSALAGIDLAALIENADPAEKLWVLDWLEQQAIKLHALLTRTPETDEALPTQGQTLSAGSDRRPRRMKLPKVVTF